MMKAFNSIQDAVNGTGEVVVNQFAPKGLNNLDAQQGIYIKQNVELLEIVSGCEMPNNYNVWPADANGECIQTGAPLFMCKEKSGCCMRILCRGECRPFKMNLYDYELCHRGSSPDPSQAWAIGNKPFKCSVYCFNRPVMEVSLNGPEGPEYIGKVIQPWTLCSLDMKIYDKNNILIYSLSGSCLQLGYLCKEMPCKACQQMVFKLKDGTGTEIGHVTKKSSGCLKACFADVDDFSIVFPGGCQKDQKALLMFCMLLIDYQFFETKQDNKKKN